MACSPVGPGAWWGLQMGQDMNKETRVLRVVKWIFLALGLGALIMFVLDPDIRAHPELVLLAGTGLTGALILHALIGILGPGSTDQ